MAEDFGGEDWGFPVEVDLDISALKVELRQFGFVLPVNIHVARNPSLTDSQRVS